MSNWGSRQTLLLVQVRVIYGPLFVLFPFKSVLAVSACSFIVLKMFVLGH